MRNCPTGYCGDPCLCKGALDHLNDADASAMIQLATERLHAIGAEAASVKHSEPMVPFKAFEVKVVLLKIGGKLIKVDHLLHRTIIRPGDEFIHSLSGMRTVILDENDEPTFVSGRDARSNLRLSYDIINYHGDVSAAVTAQGDYIDDVFIQINPTVVYLPSDLE